MSPSYGHSCSGEIDFIFSNCHCYIYTDLSFCSFSPCRWNFRLIHCATAPSTRPKLSSLWLWSGWTYFDAFFLVARNIILQFRLPGKHGNIFNTYQWRRQLSCKSWHVLFLSDAAHLLTVFTKCNSQLVSTYQCLFEVRNITLKQTTGAFSFLQILVKIILIHFTLHTLFKKANNIISRSSLFYNIVWPCLPIVEAQFKFWTVHVRFVVD